jgi:hypothetical protein
MQGRLAEDVREERGLAARTGMSESTTGPYVDSFVPGSVRERSGLVWPIRRRDYGEQTGKLADGTRCCRSTSMIWLR